MKNTKHILIILLLFSYFTGFTQNTELLPLKKLFKQTLYLPTEPTYPGFGIDYREWCKYLPDTNKTEILNLRISGFDFRDSTPINLNEYPNLQRLHLDGSRLNLLPNPIYNLTNLQVLTIKGIGRYCCSQYHYQPSEKLWQLKNLKYLTIMEAHNFFIPEKVSQLQNLEFLRIQDAEVLPLSIAQLKKLKVLIVSDPNKFKAEIKFIKTFLPNLKTMWYGTHHPNYSSYGKEVKRLLRKKVKYKENSSSKYQSFYDNGQLELEGEMINGIPDGKWTFYYENGDVKQERFYDKGTETGTWNFWVTWANKKTLVMRISYEEGAKIVTITEYYKSNLTEVKFIDGMKVKERVYYCVTSDYATNKSYYKPRLNKSKYLWKTITNEIFIKFSDGTLSEEEFSNQFVLCVETFFKEGKPIEEKRYCNK